MRNEKEVFVKEHHKYLRDGKYHFWSSHTRDFKGEFTERDTEEHKLFVKSIIAWLDKPLSADKTIIYNTEVSIGNERRCDILVQTKDKRNICIECQLSHISKKELYDRTFYYLHNRYEVMWIIKEEYYQSQYTFDRLFKYCCHLGYKVRLYRCNPLSIVFDIHHDRTKQNLHKLMIRK